MKKQGAIVLGIGGDNSDFGVGTFYEGRQVPLRKQTQRAPLSRLFAPPGHGVDAAGM